MARTWRERTTRRDLVRAIAIAIACCLCTYSATGSIARAILTSFPMTLDRFCCRTTLSSLSCLGSVKASCKTQSELTDEERRKSSTRYCYCCCDAAVRWCAHAAAALRVPRLVEQQHPRPIERRRRGSRRWPARQQQQRAMASKEKRIRQEGHKATSPYPVVYRMRTQKIKVRPSDSLFDVSRLSQCQQLRDIYARIEI